MPDVVAVVEDSFPPFRVGDLPVRTSVWWFELAFPRGLCAESARGKCQSCQAVGVGWIWCLLGWGGGFTHHSSFFAPGQQQKWTRDCTGCVTQKVVHLKETHSVWPLQNHLNWLLVHWSIWRFALFCSRCFVLSCFRVGLTAELIFVPRVDWTAERLAEFPFCLLHWNLRTDQFPGVTVLWITTQCDVRELSKEMTFAVLSRRLSVVSEWSGHHRRLLRGNATIFAGALFQSKHT